MDRTRDLNFRRGSRGAHVGLNRFGTAAYIVLDHHGQTTQVATYSLRGFAFLHCVAVDWCAHGVSWCSTPAGIVRGVDLEALGRRIAKLEDIDEIFGGKAMELAEQEALLERLEFERTRVTIHQAKEAPCS